MPSHSERVRRNYPSGEKRPADRDDDREPPSPPAPRPGSEAGAGQQEPDPPDPEREDDRHIGLDRSTIVESRPE